MTSKMEFSETGFSSSNGPLVSVVTPFFNSDDYLEECIQSVLNQTYNNWEYILVDNCSTDRSKSIAEKHAFLDSRIHFISEMQFLDQVRNYNRALNYISPESKYCKMVQADDWIYPNCLAEMVAVAESRETVGLVSSFTLYGDKPTSHGGLSLAKGPVYPGQDAGRAQLLGAVLFGSPTSVMYRSEIVRSRKPFFSTVTAYFEDTEVCFEILEDWDFGLIPRILTFNRRDNSGIWTGLEQYSPLSLYRYMFIHRFGRVFFEDEELHKLVREIEYAYYDLLGQGIVHRYGKRFWKFHTDGLKSVGLRMSYHRLGLHVWLAVVDALMNPKGTLTGLWRRVKR